MRLRAQLLLVGLATLAVPLLGWQSVRQLHASLQRTRIDAQTLTVANLRVALAESGALDGALALGAAPPAAGDWYAETARWPLFVDGYADDWQELGGEERRLSGGPGDETTLRLRAARRSGRLYLFVRVGDRRVVHHVPPRLRADAGENERPEWREILANGDAVELLVVTPDGERTHALLGAIAPGPVDVVAAAGPTAGRTLPRWRAEWVDEGEGYQLEIELPLPPAGSGVGIAAIDVTASGGSREAWAGSMDPEAMRDGTPPPGRLYHESPEVRARLAPWVTPGTRARLFDAAGRLLADVDALYLPAGEAVPPTGAAASLLDALLARAFAWLALGDLPLFPETEKTRQPLGLDAARRAALDPAEPTRRYVTIDNDRVLGTLVALGERAPGDGDGADAGGDAGNEGVARGYLLFESNEEHASAFTGSRLARLFAMLLIASLLVGSLLFVWATRLSLRIRRLSHEATRAIGEDGRAASERGGALTGADAGDEIGDLSRDLSALLARSAAYTRYLERLSARLSHELKTPLSVVRTSLEMLDRERLDTESRTLVERAGDGAERLGGIVRALVESTRLEQSVQRASFAVLEPRGWLEEAARQYRQIHPEHAFRLVATLSELGDGGSGADGVPGDTPRPARPSAVPPLRASRPLLQQALDKLVDNAVDFARAPLVGLLLARDGGGIVIAVADRGPPLGAGVAAHLFEPSFSTRGNDAHGGLGLYLVRLIAEAHGGLSFVREIDGWTVIGMRLPIGAA